MPNRFAFKACAFAAHLEKYWGRNVLRSIELLRSGQEKFAGRANITKRNTIVIASSVESLRAARRDTEAHPEVSPNTWLGGKNA
jgi:hypothetical protein